MRIHRLDGIDALTLEDVEAPPPGPGEVKLAIHGSGINFADTLMIKGQYQVKPDLPFTPGMEAAGEVIEVGPEVENLEIGDRVMGSIDVGGFAEEATTAANHLTLVPDDMDWTTAASFPVTYGTSYVALTYRSHLKAGEVLLVHGAAGGVGLTAVEIGKALGATVVATAGSDEKVEIAKAHGADFGINYTTEDIRDRVKELVGGVDVVYDPVGGEAFKASLRCINFEGRVIIIGFASGEIPQIPTNYPLVKGFSIDGFVWGAYHDLKLEVIHEGYAGLRELWAKGVLKPHVNHTFPLAETGAAMRTLLERRSKGKVVVMTRE